MEAEGSERETACREPDRKESDNRMDERTQSRFDIHVGVDPDVHNLLERPNAPGLPFLESSRESSTTFLTRIRMAEDHWALLQLGGLAMSDIGIGLSYRLPRTEFTVAATTRSIVAEDAQGKHVVDAVVDVQFSSAATPDPKYRQTLAVDAGLLEKISLVVTLDDRGFITAINSEAGRDVTPVINLLSKAISLSVPILGITRLPRFDSRDGDPIPLEDQWETKYGNLAILRRKLTSQLQRILDEMSDLETAVQQIATLGAAASAVQSQLATVSEARRAWIAGHSQEGRTRTWRLAPGDLHRVSGEGLPATLPDTPASGISADLDKMVSKCGVLAAIFDPDRPEEKPEAITMGRDEIALRRSRSAIAGIYTRDSSGTWNLNPESVLHLDIVDDYNQTDPLSIDGSWWRMRKFEISYHPDMSLKSFGVSSTSSMTTIATSAGDLLEAAKKAKAEQESRPSAEANELATRKTQLDLLKTASEYEVLAATRNSAVELAVLEQKTKLASLAVKEF